MEEDYQKALELIFAYDYECCMFKHNICGDQSEVPGGMPDSSDPLPPEFFMNLSAPRPQQPLRPYKPRCIKAKGQRNLRGVLPLGIKDDLSLSFFSPLFFKNYVKGLCVAVKVYLYGTTDTIGVFCKFS